MILKFYMMILQCIVVLKIEKNVKNFKDGGHDVISKNRLENLVAEKSQQPVGVRF